MREIVALSIGLGAPWLGWLASLRRTPYAMTWALATFFLTSFSLAIALAGAEGGKVTTGGFLAVMGGAVTLALFPALCTEVTAADNPHGEIRRWRERKHDKSPKRKKPSGKWQVVTMASSSAHQEGSPVSLFIQRGDVRRLIGSADPIAEMDEFMTLKVSAETAAEQFNTLQIEEAS